MIEYDVAVIGAGPGGYVAAIRGAQRGARVCLIEQEKVGGTCLNLGCIPTKALAATAHLLERIEGAGEHGIEVEKVTFDFGRAALRKDAVVEQLVGGVEGLLKSNGVELFRGSASLEGPGAIRIRGKDVVGHIRARKIILATGSVPARPESLSVDGKNVLTSDEILVMKERSSSLLIVGGGYIGCEFASIFSAFGTEVTLLEGLPRILARSDRQAVREVEKSLAAKGVRIHTETTVEKLRIEEDSVSALLSSGESIVAEKVLVAVGRVPNTLGLGLEEAGIEMEKGAVVVDERLQTSLEGVYAIGDVTGGIQLAHVASYQAGVAIENALGGDEKVDYGVVPSVVFTLPELAQVGLTEEECKEAGIDVAVGRFAYQGSGKALCDGERRGSVKILAGREGGRLLGASIVGSEASSLVAEVAVVMSGGGTAEELAKVIHAHPTLPEIVMEAAEDVAGLAVHKGVRKRRTAPPSVD